MYCVAYLWNKYFRIQLNLVGIMSLAFYQWVVRDICVDVAEDFLLARLPLVVQDDCERSKVRLSWCRSFIQNLGVASKSKDWRVLSFMHAEYNSGWKRNNRCVLSDLWLRMLIALFQHILFWHVRIHIYYLRTPSEVATYALPPMRLTYFWCHNCCYVLFVGSVMLNNNFRSAERTKAL